MKKIVHCQECSKETTNPKFCSTSCAATFHNKNRIDKCPNKDKTKIGICSCGKEVEINIRASLKNVKCEICKGQCNFCQKPAKFKLSSGNLCCSEFANSCPSVRLKNSNGLKLAYKRGVKFNKFTAEQREKSNIKQIETAKQNSFGEDILRLTDKAKKYLLEERGYKCEECKITEWNGKTIVFEIDHIDGNRFNNKKENLKILCPNCHSQTHTWRGRNSNNSKRKHDIDLIIQVFKRTGNIHKTLIELNMAPKGANYDTIKKILIKNKIEF